MYVSSRKAFTLIELLVVIAIIAILAVVVVLTLNPAELLRQSRDSNRLSDLATLTNAINIYNTDQGGSQNFSLGTSGIAYLSIPDPTATSSAGTNCSGLGISGSYHCPASSTYRNVNGTGWIPVNLTQMSSGAPLSSLPIDPTNSTSSNFYYCYVTNGTTFEVMANPESQKYIALASSSPGLFTKGSNQTLSGCSFSIVSIATGTVAQANMKMSIANGTAFADFSSAGTLTPYIGDKLTITDSGGHQLTGWIKASGSGETYGSEQLSNTAFNDTSYVWAYGTGVSVASVSGGHTGNGLKLIQPTPYAGGAGENWTAIVGALYKHTLWMMDGGHGSDEAMSEAEGSYISYGSWSGSSASWLQLTMYGTAFDTSSQVSWDSGAATSNSSNLYVDDMSIKQVLTPSATGVTIVSASGGSTYNWTSEDSGFNEDDSGGYTYSISHS
jgi:prepilin-type N-terminal cleavage/methylation domain-containing protein